MLPGALRTVVACHTLGNVVTGLRAGRVLTLECWIMTKVRLSLKKWQSSLVVLEIGKTTSENFLSQLKTIIPLDFASAAVSLIFGDLVGEIPTNTDNHMMAMSSVNFLSLYRYACQVDMNLIFIAPEGICASRLWDETCCFSVIKLFRRRDIKSLGVEDDKSERTWPETVGPETWFHRPDVVLERFEELLTCRQTCFLDDLGMAIIHAAK